MTRRHDTALHRPCSPLMMSAIALFRNSRGQFVEARTLLDTCATANFAMRGSIPIGAIVNMCTVSKDCIELDLRSLHSDFQKITFLTVPKIADSIPNVPLADSHFHVLSPEDILIGSGATVSLLSIGQINLSDDNGDLNLQ